MVRCYLCGLDSTQYGLSQRSCSMRKYRCLRGLPVDHPFRPLGPDVPCTNLTCWHARKCTKCHKTGHDSDTLELDPKRYASNEKLKGRSISRLYSAGPIERIDFVCENVDDAKAVSMCAGIRAGCEARFNARQVKASSAGAMTSNLFAVGSSAVETIRLIGQEEIKSRMMHKSNKRAHELAVRGRNARMCVVNAALAAAERIRLESSRPTGTLPALSALRPPSSVQALSVAAKAAKRVKADALATDVRVRTRQLPAPIGQGSSMAQVDGVYLSGWGPGHRDRVPAALPLVPYDRRVVWSSR